MFYLPLSLFLLLHNFYYFPSSMFLFPPSPFLLFSFLNVFYSPPLPPPPHFCYTFFHPQIHRPPIDPTSTPHRPHIDPFFPSSTIFIIFPPQCFFPLHHFYYFLSSMFSIPLLHLHLLFYSIYFSIHKYIDRLSTQNRPHIDPTSTPHRPYIDPKSTPHRPLIDPTSTPHRRPHRPYIDPISTLHRLLIDSTSTPHRPYIDPTLNFFLTQLRE